jgi:bacteriorhodopsin
MIVNPFQDFHVAGVLAQEDGEAVGKSRRWSSSPGGVMSSSIDMLSNSQFQTVYNVFSFALASMLFSSIFLIVSQPRVLPRYRQALVVSSMVCGIAAYHYIRIFNSFNEAYTATAVGGDYNLTPLGFNEAYRYVGWLLTVPLLLLETVAVLALPRVTRSSLLTK